MSNEEEILKLEPREDYESKINARSKIVEILTKVESRLAYSDKLLDRELKEFEDADRRFITEIVNGVLRWRLRLDWYLDQLYLGEYENLIPEVKNNLRSSVYQLSFMGNIPPYAVLFEAVEIAKSRFNQKTANLVNAVLRNYLRQQKKFEILETQLDVLDKIAFRYSHPRWLVQRWIEYWGIDEVAPLCEANNRRPRLAVRLNRLVTENEVFFKTLDENGIVYEVHSDFPNFVWIDNFQDFRKLDFLIKGWVSVQDVSTGLPVLALDPQPEEKVLDMCAAPGGKSGYIAERMKNRGTLVALERRISRVRLARENLHRMELTHFYTVAADSNDLPTNMMFDRILVDAPCSGFGVLSKRVDLKWKRSEQDILNMKGVQLGLLNSASRAVKKDGIIVYSTCTIEPEENERVVEIFLEQHPNFEMVKLDDLVPLNYLANNSYFIQTFPHKHKMDGSFAVRFRRVAV